MIQLGICNEMFEGWDLARVCQLVREVGFEGIELAPFTLASRITDLTADQRRAIRVTITAAGLKTIGLHWLLAKTEEFYLTSPDPAVQVRTGDYFQGAGRGDPRSRRRVAGPGFAPCNATSCRG